MSEAVSNRRKAIVDKIIGKAVQDSEFRDALVKDPKAAIAGELKVSIPDGIDIEVLQERADKVYLVLPVDPGNVELPDNLLKHVHGGVPPCDCACC